MSAMTPIERLGFAVAASRWLEFPFGPAGILSLLVQHAPEMVRFDRLAAQGGVKRPKIIATSIPVQLCHVRAALDQVGYPAVIETCRGEGYCFVGDVTEIMAHAERFA